MVGSAIQSRSTRATTMTTTTIPQMIIDRMRRWCSPPPRSRCHLLAPLPLMMLVLLLLSAPHVRGHAVPATTSATTTSAATTTAVDHHQHSDRGVTEAPQLPTLSTTSLITHAAVVAADVDAAAAAGVVADVVADGGDIAALEAAKRPARVAPPWRHLAAAKHNGQLNWQLPPTRATTTTARSVAAAANAPRFGRVPGTIEVWPGHTAILSCVVHNLGDRMVSWIRVSDLQILTAGPVVFTSDSRMSVDFEAATAAAEHRAEQQQIGHKAPHNRLEDYEDEEDGELEEGLGYEDDEAHLSAAPLVLETSWPLTIRQVRASDVGLYECQINTEPKMKGNVTLVVHEPQLADIPFAGVSIDGDREPVALAGSTIRLVCRSPTPPPIQHGAGGGGGSGELTDGGPVPLVSWLLDGRTLTGSGTSGEGGDGSGGGGGGGGDVADAAAVSGRGGVNVMTEVSPAGVVSTLQLAAASEADAGAYECRVQDVGADAVRVQVVRKGGGGAAQAETNGIIVQPWRLSDYQQQNHERALSSGAQLLQISTALAMTAAFMARQFLQCT